MGISRLIQSVILAGSLALLGFAGSVVPNQSEFQIGSTRAEIFEMFGAPARTQSFTKTDEGIWGPIEEFWSRIPLGSRVEIWAYPAEGGTVELYFIDNSDRVQGTGFAPEGAVFEPRR